MSLTNSPPPSKRFVTHAEIAGLANDRAHEIYERYKGQDEIRIHPIPRGGIPALYATIAALRLYIRLPDVVITPHPEEAHLFFDDLVDSGNTERNYINKNPRAQFMTLVRKGEPGWPLGEWLVFPWEQGREDTSAHDICTRLLQHIGENPERGGLIDTPGRYIKAWEEWTSGYKQDPVAIIKSFEDGAELYDEMIHVDHIPFYSQCEHHLAPFFGEVTFAYVPEKRVVGLSKMNRLVEVFARRLQVQERMTAQIVDAFCSVVSPKGAAISVRGRHMCMESRGVKHAGCLTTTTALRGVLKDGVPRAEFYALSAR